MKKKITKCLSIILSMALIIAALPLVGVDLFATTKAKTISEYKIGDIIDFGSYPQSEITDENLLAELNSLDFNWISYDYYTGTDNWEDGNMCSSDYMKYADVTYNESKYRAVTFSQYRPYNTGLIISADNTHQNDNGYYLNTTYWFEYEPLRWRVLDPEAGFVLCESIIDSQPYNNTIYRDNSEYYQDKRCEDYANDYATSWIRTWLNDSFYNTAFTNDEKGKIKNSAQDNSCSWNAAYNGETTYDKIFLLSYDEAIQSKYNFSSDPYRDTTRCAQGTDYAQAQGLYVNSSNKVENSCWWLRYSGIPSYYAYVVDNCGEVLDGGYTIHVNHTNIGVRPALKFNAESNIFYETKSGACGENATWKFDESKGVLTINGTGVMFNYDYGNRPWEDCVENIRELIIDKSITAIGDNSFVGCVNLANVTFSEGVKTIGESAFSCCGITNLTIPNSIEIIKQNAFSSCFNLENINLPDKAVQICTFAFDDTKYYNDEKNWNDNVLYIGKHLIKAKENVSEDYFIRDETKTIADNAFHKCSNLVSVTIPNSVVLIGHDTFLYCSKLNNITVHEENFYYSNDEYGVLFNKEKTELIHYPTGNKRTEYVIPDDVVIIHSSAFAGSDNLLDITIPNSVTQINEAAFSACKLIRRFDIPNSVTTIGNAAFSGCTALEEITLSNSLTRIEGSTFNGSENLKSVTIPKSVKVIDYYAFFCTNLKHVYFCGSEESWNSISVFPGNESIYTATIHYNYCPHNYISSVILPTCTEQGYTIHTCYSCRDTYIDNYVDATGEHQYSPRKGNDPTCTEDGFVEYCCDICGSSKYTETIAATGHKFENGFCTVCGEKDPSYTEEPEYNYTFSIQSPSRTEIRNKDGIILHANVEGNSPAGSYVKWESNNGNFDTSADGSNLKIIAKNKGNTTFTAILCDADGNELARDSVDMYSKSGFFDKIGGFFRSLFGTTKIYEW